MTQSSTRSNSKQTRPINRVDLIIREFLLPRPHVCPSRIRFTTTRCDLLRSSLPYRLVSDACDIHPHARRRRRPPYAITYVHTHVRARPRRAPTHSRAAPVSLVVPCDTDLCALNLPKGTIARDFVSAPERAIVGFPRPPPIGGVRHDSRLHSDATQPSKTCCRWLYSPFIRSGRRAPISPPPSPPGKRLPCGARLSPDPTLRSPSSMHFRLRRAGDPG